MTTRALVAAALVATCTLTACSKPTAEVYNWKGPVGSGNWLRLRNNNGDFTVTEGTGDSATIRFEIQRSTPFAPAAQIKVLSIKDGVLACVVYGDDNACSADAYKAGNSYKQGAVSFLGGETKAVGIITLPRGVKLDVESTNGDVTVNGQTAELLLQTVNGNVDAKGVRGIARLSTTNGDIRLAVDSAGGTLNAETTNGDVNLQLPAALNALLTMRTTNGELTLGYPGNVANATKRTISATLGTGGTPIEVQTTNGDVTVKKVGEP
jgi:hypothetical protein